MTAAWGGVLAGFGTGIALLGVTAALVNAIEQRIASLGVAFWVVAVIGGGLMASGIAMIAVSLIRDDPAAPSATAHPPAD
jgi:hypothetical protein